MSLERYDRVYQYLFSASFYIGKSQTISYFPHFPKKNEFVRFSQLFEHLLAPVAKWDQFFGLKEQVPDSGNIVSAIFREAPEDFCA